jgi:hypothetical protein
MNIDLAYPMIKDIYSVHACGTKFRERLGSLIINSLSFYNQRSFVV